MRTCSLSQSQKLILKVGRRLEGGVLRVKLQLVNQHIVILQNSAVFLVFKSGDNVMKFRDELLIHLYNNQL